MILLVAATEMEALPLADKKFRQPHECFIAGVGPLETAVRLTRRLSEGRRDISLVINFGVAGAYAGSGAGLLDICLAESEVLGDFGICHQETVEPFAEQLVSRAVFLLESRYLAQAGAILGEHDLAWNKGIFVTVNGATATAKRGAMLRAAHNGLCENMEGGAVARVCEEFVIPCLEVRCVSNMVEDRNLANWQLAAAVQKCGQAVSLLVDNIVLF
ncbi:MAG TPA: futalosine hydrolase [Desulfobulbaceae bacterium]|nr:MAG: futalosine hydrolase [Deltaproteobacteria bacterium RIFOXYD12_FULL_53_23]HCC55167.1 futalosine hydrolase [Desulfobulbaceae bacterium]